jgi:hypothetical protein
MPTRRTRRYIGELYLTGPAESAAAQVRDAVVELRAEGRAVSHLCTIAVPEDELCLHLFDAESAQLVGEVGRRAETPFDRVVAAATESPSPDPKGASDDEQDVDSGRADRARTRRARGGR